MKELRLQWSYQIASGQWCYDENKPANISYPVGPPPDYYKALRLPLLQIWNLCFLSRSWAETLHVMVACMKILTRTYKVKICHQNVVKHCISFYILCHYLLSFTSCWVIICRYLMNYWWLSDFVVWFKLNSVSNIQNLGVKAAFILTLMFIIFRNLQLEWNWIMDGQ